MNKIAKWFLIIFGVFMVLFVAAAIIIPAVFKDDIKAMIEEQAAANVNADVVFDDFSLSFFKNFPNVTATLENLGVMNRAPFAGEMLFATESFEVEINLFDILTSDATKVQGIKLVRPIANVKVLEDGRANYDIAIASEDTVQAEDGDFAFSIDHWEIVDGDISYDDRQMKFNLILNGLNHSGSGDFNQDEFDIESDTEVDTLTTSFDGVEYLTNKRVQMDLGLHISEDYTRYQFNDNKTLINDFAIHANGWLKLNEEDMTMDLTFDSPENSFKSLLSLVPGMYTKDFGDIRTEGDLTFKGFAKGTYSEKTMPAFNLAVAVKDAMFQYPDLPTAVKNINMDLLIDNKDGIIDNTVIDLKKMHADLGSNPIDARALITRLYPTNIDGQIKARIDLKDLSEAFPMEGTSMKGIYSLTADFKGVYDSLKKLIPAINADMSLAEGYVKSEEYPVTMDDIHFKSSVKNTSGKMAETTIRFDDFTMLMDQDKLTGELLLQNLDNYTWDAKLNGTADLGNIMKLFPVEGMSLAGKIKADIQSRGNYADLEAERYQKLPTSGTASLQDFSYTTTDMPKVTIATAAMNFDPKQITLRDFKGQVGKSDLSATGLISNYLGYLFGENETIQGKVNLSSSLLDLNEFMSGEEEPVAEDTTSFSVIPVPQNIDFVLSSNIKSAKFLDFTLSNAVGDIIVRDGVANLSGLRFNMLGGSFVVSGAYNTKNISKPLYDLALKIDNMSIQQAASSFSIVKTFAPIAGLVNGNFSTDFKIGGQLLQNMMPNMGTVDGSGLIKIVQASLKDSKLISGITSLTKLDNTDDVTLKDVLMSASIDDGKLYVKPFDFNFGEYKTTVSGSTALDGSIDYNMVMNVPAGKLGTQFNALLSRYSDSQKSASNTVPVTIALKGKYNDPKPTLVMEEQAAAVKETVKEAAKEEGAKAIEKAVEGTKAESIVKDILGNSKKDSVTADTASTPPSNTVKEKVEEEAKKKIQGLLKRKKN